VWLPRADSIELGNRLHMEPRANSEAQQVK
jgi:hypothetical protein